MSIGCRNLRVTDCGRHRLAVDFLEVADGETVAVLGPNGAGKSTLLRALARLEPAGGEVLLDGEPVNSCSYLALQAEGRDVTTIATAFTHHARLERSATTSSSTQITT